VWEGELALLGAALARNKWLVAEPAEPQRGGGAEPERARGGWLSVWRISREARRAQQGSGRATLQSGWRTAPVLRGAVCCVAVLARNKVC
jgi:hypothetical protein